MGHPAFRSSLRPLLHGNTRPAGGSTTPQIWPSTVQQPQRHSSGLRHLFISATGSFRRRNTQSAGSMNQTGQVPASIWFTHRGICRLGTSVIHRHGSPYNRSNPEINKKQKRDAPIWASVRSGHEVARWPPSRSLSLSKKNSSTKLSLSVVVIDSVGVDEIPQKKNRLVEIPVCSRSKRTRHPWPRQQISPPWPPLGQWAPESHQFPLNRSMAYSTYRPALRRRPTPFNRRSGCCMGENHPAVLKRRCPFPHRFRHL